MTPRSLRLLFILAVLAGIAWGEKIQHRFLAVDESRGQLLWVDEKDPSRNWTLALPAKYRDLQLIGKGRFLFSTAGGYREYELATRKLLKELTLPALGGATSVRRRADGSTVVACNQSNITLVVLSDKDEVVKRFEFSGLKNVRLMRLTPRGTALFGANNSLVEASLADGSLLRNIPITNAKHIYQALALTNGNTLVATGYGATVLELDPAGRVVATRGGKAGFEDKGFHFFAGMQILPNGNVVVCNWTGHKADDSAKGVQLVEWNGAGQLVWSWHDPVAAGTLHGVLILDSLDPEKFCDDLNGVLASVR